MSFGQAPTRANLPTESGGVPKQHQHSRLAKRGAVSPRKKKCDEACRRRILKRRRVAVYHVEGEVCGESSEILFKRWWLKLGLGVFFLPGKGTTITQEEGVLIEIVV